MNAFVWSSILSFVTGDNISCPLDSVGVICCCVVSRSVSGPGSGSVCGASLSCGLISELFEPTRVTLLRLLGDDGALITVISVTGRKTYLKKKWN
jgi:hypothetical protein